jgi:hypothetical protein
MALQSFGERNLCHSNFSRPLSHRKLPSIECHKAIVSLVIALLFLVRPATVLPVVAIVVVDAIQRMLRRARAHIGKKLLKRVPLLAD